MYSAYVMLPPPLSMMGAMAWALPDRRVRLLVRRSPTVDSVITVCYRSIFPIFLAYIVPSTRGCSPWRLDTVMSLTGRGCHSVLRIFKGHWGTPDTTQHVVLFQRLDPTSD
ncbi:hypothetical protein QYF36_023414 [Acer negundo]|nr:hypothetical protein QYF36_023414 [Acer negundo]